MRDYVLKRLALAVPTVLLASLIIFTIIRLVPGSVIEAKMTEYAVFRSKAEELAALQALGLDKPFHEQYLAFLGQLARGSLGNSLYDQRPVTSILAPRIPVTLELAALTVLFSGCIGIPIGIIAAVRQNSPVDYVLRSMSILGLAIPDFWIGVMVILIPALVFPSAAQFWKPLVPLQYTTPQENLGRHVLQFIVPAAILGFYLSASLMRMTRSMMLEVLREDYVRTAFAKGLKQSTVVVRHATRNALIPVVTILGQQVAFLAGGSVVMESIFGLPGMGLLLLQSITFRDYPIVQAIVLLVASAIILTNLLVDVSYGFLDPRIRAG